MRLIDADAFIEENQEIIDCEIDHPKYQDTLRELIDQSPTIKTFILADIEENYRKGLEKGLEETIRCAICENSMKSERGCDGSCRYDEKLFERIVQAIKDNEVQRPHGEWIQDFTRDTATICSKCGEKAWYKEYSGWITKSNFCPNCGADMRPREGESE